MFLKIYYEHPAVYEEKRGVSWYSLRSFERQFRKRILGCLSVLFVFLAVKRCLDVFFMVLKVGFILLVLLKEACFAVVLRLHIYDIANVDHLHLIFTLSNVGVFHE